MKRGRKMIPRIKSICLVCSREFIKKEYGAGSDIKFCSKACAGKCRRTGKRFETKKCPNCGNNFEHRNKFCCEECRVNFLYPINISFCEICGLSFEHKNNKTNRYCSFKCSMDAARSKVCTKCGGELTKCYGGLKLCEKCHDEYKFKNYLTRLKRKFANAYGDEKIELGLEIRKAEAVSDVGLAKIKGDQKWLKNHPNEIKLATENTKLTAFRI